MLFFSFSFEREGSPEDFYNPNEDAEPGMQKQGLYEVFPGLKTHLGIAKIIWNIKN